MPKTITFNEIMLNDGAIHLNKVHKMNIQEIIENQNFYNDMKKICFTSEGLDTEILNLYPRNGLISAVSHAYSHHIPLKIKPDDLWISICNAIGFYVTSCTTNSEVHETVRNFFVSHGEKNVIEIDIDSFDKNNIGVIVDLICEEIKKNTNNNIIDWLTPNFTTTTNIDKVTCQISIMNVVKNFFSYHMMLGCGLSQITLDGTKDDWLLLKEKIKYIENINSLVLNEWLSVLLPIIDNFILIFDEVADFDFWQRICTYRRVGSGNQQEYGGWIFAFSPFDSEGKYLLNSREEIEKTNIYTFLLDSKASLDLVNVPVKMNDNGIPREFIFCSGILGGKYDSLNNLIEPKVGYCIIEKIKLDLETFTQMVIKHVHEKIDKIGQNFYLSKADPNYENKFAEEKRINENTKHYAMSNVELYGKHFCRFTYELCQILKINEDDITNFIRTIGNFIYEESEKRDQNIKNSLCKLKQRLLSQLKFNRIIQDVKSNDTVAIDQIIESICIE